MRCPDVAPLFKAGSRTPFYIYFWSCNVNGVSDLAEALAVAEKKESASWLRREKPVWLPARGTGKKVSPAYLFGTEVPRAQIVRVAVSTSVWESAFCESQLCLDTKLIEPPFRGNKKDGGTRTVQNDEFLYGCSVLVLNPDAMGDFVVDEQFKESYEATLGSVRGGHAGTPLPPIPLLDEVVLQSMPFSLHPFSMHVLRASRLFDAVFDASGCFMYYVLGGTSFEMWFFGARGGGMSACPAPPLQDSLLLHPDTDIAAILRHVYFSGGRPSEDQKYFVESKGGVCHVNNPRPTSADAMTLLIMKKLPGPRTMTELRDKPEDCTTTKLRYALANNIVVASSSDLDYLVLQSNARNAAPVLAAASASAAAAGASLPKRLARGSGAESKRKKPRRQNTLSAVAAHLPATQAQLLAAPVGYDSADDFESPAW